MVLGVAGEAQDQRLVIVVRVMMAKTANAGDAEGRLRVAVLDVEMHATAAVGSGSGGLVVTGDYGGEHGCRPRAGRQPLGLERGHVGRAEEHGDGGASERGTGRPQRQSWSRKAGGRWRVMGQLLPAVQRMRSGTSVRVCFR